VIQDSRGQGYRGSSERKACQKLRGRLRKIIIYWRLFGKAERFPETIFEGIGAWAQAVCFYRAEGDNRISYKIYE
jgi:hypothetical protein